MLEENLKTYFNSLSISQIVQIVDMESYLRSTDAYKSFVDTYERDCVCGALGISECSCIGGIRDIVKYALTVQDQCLWLCEQECSRVGDYMLLNNDINIADEFRVLFSANYNGHDADIPVGGYNFDDISMPIEITKRDGGVTNLLAMGMQGKLYIYKLALTIERQYAGYEFVPYNFYINEPLRFIEF